MKRLRISLGGSSLIFINSGDEFLKRNKEILLWVKQIRIYSPFRKLFEFSNLLHYLQHTQQWYTICPLRQLDFVIKQLSHRQGDIILWLRHGELWWGPNISICFESPFSLPFYIRLFLLLWNFSINCNCSGLLDLLFDFFLQNGELCDRIRMTI